MIFEWLFDPHNWDPTVRNNIPQLIADHLVYTIVALVIAAAIAIPVGFYIGHTNRFAFIAINAGNAGRALPTFGLISLLAVLIGVGLVPAMIALVVLAIPPLLTSTYAGIRAVDPSVSDAARGMGMRSAQVLWKIEVPIALPLIFTGLRSATLQVVATATVAAYVGLGGLGRPLLDGLTLNRYDEVFGGAILVALLAILLDLLLEWIQHLTVSPGIARRGTQRSPIRRRNPMQQGEPDPAEPFTSATQIGQR